jgi:hypothetical protein
MTNNHSGQGTGRLMVNRPSSSENRLSDLIGYLVANLVILGCGAALVYLVWSGT